MSIDKANVQFWNELCGTTLAKELGITDHSTESLTRFDEAYIDFYPYLLKHVKLAQMADKKVLEIGLGYGTMGQKIFETGADYFGLDLADQPPKMMGHRLLMQDLPKKTIQGSALTIPLKSGSLDFVVSIGCFHHTGDVQRCLDETYRVLKPGGRTILMVYNRYSYSQWLRWPGQTGLALLRDIGLYNGEIVSNEDQKRRYDANIAGTGAPETTFLSIHQLRRMLRCYSKVEFYKERCRDLRLGIYTIPRKKLLSSLGRWAGLDIYLEAQK